MKAILLSGGFGTRLREKLSNLPKVMAPINHRPFLEYILDALNIAGIKEVILSTHYMSEKIESHLGDSYKTMQINYVKEPEPLGTGGAIRYALEAMNITEPVLVLNGDSYIDYDFKKLLQEKTKSISMIVKKMQNTDRYGTVEIRDNKAIAFREKQPGLEGFINAGVYLISPNIFNNTSLHGNFSFETDFLQKYIDILNIHTIISDGFFIDIGVPEDYERAKKVLGV